MLEQQSSLRYKKQFSTFNGFFTDEQLLILIWKLDKPIDSFIGGELKLFFKTAATLALWAPQKNLVSRTNLEWAKIAAALKLWEKMHAFITKAEEKEDDDYGQEIQQFEKDANFLYK